MCEEIWTKLQNHRFVSIADWPVYDKNKVNIKAEETECLIKNVMDDTSNILKATKIIPKEIYYYTAASWKWKAYLTALELSMSARMSISDLMKTLIADPELKQVAAKVAKFARRVAEEIQRIPEDIKQKQIFVGIFDETGLLKYNAEFFEREFNIKLHVFNENEMNLFDPQRKAESAKPYRPAIYIA